MKPIPGAFHVYRYGDVEPSGIADALEFAKEMLTEGSIEGDVRDFDGRVLWTYTPKKPLAKRLEEARAKAERANIDLVKAQSAQRSAEFQLKRLEALAAEQTQPKMTQQPLLIGGDS